jgi:hypothetical protein
LVVCWTLLGTDGFCAPLTAWGELILSGGIEGIFIVFTGD